MTKEITQLECLSQISTAIIEKPVFSLSNFGIEKDKNTMQLTYNGVVAPNVQLEYASIAASSMALKGTTVLVKSAALASMGLVMSVMASSLAAAGGVSATGVGLVAAPFILLHGYDKYKKKKVEQEEKDRVYKEIVAKQQAAFNKQKQCNRELEEQLRIQTSSTEQMKDEIRRLQNEINNLTGLIEILTEQINQYKQTA